MAKSVGGLIDEEELVRHQERVSESRPGFWIAARISAANARSLRWQTTVKDGVHAVQLLIASATEGHRHDHKILRTLHHKRVIHHEQPARLVVSDRFALVESGDG